MNLENDLALREQEGKSIESEKKTETAEKNFLIETQKDELYQAILLASRAISRNSVQAILSSVYLKASKEKEEETLIVCSTDLDLTILSKIKAKVKIPGEIALPAQKIQELLSKLSKQETLSIEGDQADNIKLVCGRAKFDLKGFSVADFPKEELGEEKSLKENKARKIKLPAGHLKRISKLVGFATEKREINNILSGICLEINENSLDFGATDGSRLAHYKLTDFSQEIEKELESETKIQKAVIPSRAFYEMSRLVQSLEDQSLVELKLSEDTSKISLQLEEKFFSSSLIEGDYPEYQQLIPSDFSQKALLRRTELLESIEKVSVFANEKNRVIKLFFEENEKKLWISANAPDLGEARDQIDLLGYTGEDFTVALNVNFTSECLRGLETEEIELHLKGYLDPLILTLSTSQKPEENQEPKSFEYLYLLMPVQTKGLEEY